MAHIYKYPAATQPIHLPEGFKIVHFDYQYDRPTIWAEVDPTKPLVPTNLVIFPTGQNLPSNAKHIKTAMQGPFVWHLYELI